MTFTHPLGGDVRSLSPNPIALSDLPSLSYVAVTPAHNEAANLHRLATSLAAQIIKPREWLIVDDRSTDDTRAIALALGREHDWIRVVQTAGSATSALSEGLGRRLAKEALAFSFGVETIREPPSVVVKLDADISFGPDFFARLLRAFESDETLGIAGGICHEWAPDHAEWRPHFVTGSHVRGATRAYRWDCLQAVLPFEPRQGWDGIDSSKANAHGWSSRSIDGLPFSTIG